MQLVDNIPSFKFIISVIMSSDFPFEVNMGGEHDKGFDIHDAVEELKEEVLYLVKCTNDESEKALTNACPLAEESQCVSEGMPFFFFLSMDNSCCHCHYDLARTRKYCDQYELQCWASHNILPLYCMLARYWHRNYKCQR